MIASVVIIGLVTAVIKYLFPQLTMENIQWKAKKTMASFHLHRIKKKLKAPFGFNAKAPLTDLSAVGITSPPGGWYRESPRSLDKDKNAIDSVNFWGVSSNGDVLITRIAHRHGRQAEVLVYLRLHSGEEYQLPNQPDCLILNTNSKEFTAAGLSFEILEPLRRWKISFNGVLRKVARNPINSDDDHDHDITYVQFQFIWQPMHLYATFPKDLNVKLMSSILASQQWSNDLLGSFQIMGSTPEWYEQLGFMNGTVSIEGKEEINIYLRGTKERKTGTLDWNSVNQFLTIKGIDANGTFYTFFGQSIPDGSLKIYHGQVFHASGISLLSVSECEMNQKNDISINGLELNVVAENKTYKVQLEKANHLCEVFVGKNWDCHLQTLMAKMTVNGKDGIALVVIGKQYKGGCPHEKRLCEPLLSVSVTDSGKLVTTFADEDCKNSKVVGGKGASLALMASLDKNGKDFFVPPGCCITKNGFCLYLKENPKIDDEITTLQNVAWKKVEGDLQEECKKVVESIINNQSIPENLNSDIVRELRNTFGEAFESKAYAVRSSAIGEDGKELSAAGQNETFLGVKGFEKIIKAIIHCWASQFSFRSVEYKRQNGQFINEGMGVVIQEMVPAEVAGILFTCDPLSGNPMTITITANYGLGETVVSATADPDTVVLHRSWNNKLKIRSKEIGKKTMKVTMTSEGGTVENSTHLTEESRCSLTDTQSFKLGEIAIYLEKCYSDTRDIEWAVFNGNVYILQSRPVTNDVVMSDFQLLHEFDTPLRTDTEYFTSANAAEVLPGSMCHASITGIFRAQMCGYLSGFIMDNKRYDPTSNVGFACFYNHFIMDQVHQKSFNLSKTKNSMAKAMDVAFFGRIVDDTKIVEKAMDRFEKLPLKLHLLLLSLCIYGIPMASRVVKQCEKKFRNYPIPGINSTNSKEAYHSIGQAMGDTYDGFLKHIMITMGSTVANGIILNILSGGSDFKPEHYTDFANLIGSTNGAESGDVPFTIKRLALLISKTTDAKAFSQLPVQDAYKWMKNGDNTVTKMFEEFLQKHGHRCFKEFDLRSTSWGMEPTKVVKIIQDTLKTPVDVTDESKKKSVKSAIDDLNTPLSSFKKWILSWVVSFTRVAVMRREQTKSLIIKYVDCMRHAYRHLATLMVQEGYIPDPELVFFITHEELGQLLETRSPRIIMRAKRRHRLFPYMDGLKFPELMVGFPKPIEENTKCEELLQTTEVKGYPVCKGIVKGVARVIRDFSEVNTIQKGDILITHCTDIGWSPYFPMLSGVVTEIGGLISHGAVVAREYDLPCIIDAENATNIFTSGEAVLLNASNGTIHKLKSTEDRTE